MPVSAGLFLLHALGRAGARLRCAAESRIVAAGLATVLEFGDVTLGMANDGQGRFAACARMATYKFGWLSMFAQDLRSLHSLLHASDPDRLALGAHHRDGVIGFQRIDLLLGLDSLEHEQVLAAFHRLHFLGGAGRNRRPGQHGECDRHDCGKYAVFHFHNCVFLSIFER